MTRFDDICTTPYAKRAAEVAIAGGHTVWFIGPHESPKRELAALVTDYGNSPREEHEEWLGTLSRGYDVAPCPCGYYKDPEVECTCSVEQISLWRTGNWPRVMPEMALYVTRPEPREVIRWLQTGRTGEAHESIMDRIRGALADVVPEGVEDNAWALLQQLIKVKHISPRQAKGTLAVARTVARLGGASWVECSHMAEAVQYRVDKYT